MSSSRRSRIVRGLSTACGFAVGPVFVFRGDGDMPIPEYVVAPGREADELLRFRRAVFEAKRDLEGLVTALRERTGRNEVKIFECHLMLVDDVVLAGETEKYILENRINAEAAVRRTADHARAAFGRMNDPYFRERVRDLDDVERRLLKNLLGVAANPSLELNVPSVIVADDLTPSETMQLPRDLVLGFATNGGSATSHVALLARAMGIPAVTGLLSITARVRPGETVLLDGTAGTVTLSPSEKEIRAFEGLIQRQREIADAVADGGAVGRLKDGGEVLLFANLHPGVPFEDVRALGARGVGLYRSEYLWLAKEGEPSEDEQVAAYREVAEFAHTLAPNGSAIIRVLDIGGDKLVRGISQRTDTRAREANPFLGNRSIRYLLANPSVFRTQLRAILRASAYGRVKILYPMISCVEELRQADALLDDVRASLRAEGVPFADDIPVGAMIEVPASAINAAALAKYVDFFSIGTNDLVQYTLAADRGNESVSHLYQPLHPAILHLVRHVIKAAEAAGICVSVCGESAADPLVGVLWVAMGCRVLSMSATYIPVISRILSRLNRADLDAYRAMVEALGDDVTGAEVMSACRGWMLGKLPDLASVI